MNMIVADEKGLLADIEASVTIAARNLGRRREAKVTESSVRAVRLAVRKLLRFQAQHAVLVVPCVVVGELED